MWFTNGASVIGIDRNVKDVYESLCGLSIDVIFDDGKSFVELGLRDKIRHRMIKIKPIGFIKCEFQCINL
jgi:hypothetical protein